MVLHIAMRMITKRQAGRSRREEKHRVFRDAIRSSTNVSKDSRDSLDVSSASFDATIKWKVGIKIQHVVHSVFLEEWGKVKVLEDVSMLVGRIGKYETIVGRLHSGSVLFAELEKFTHINAIHRKPNACISVWLRRSNWRC